MGRAGWRPASSRAWRSPVESSWPSRRETPEKAARRRIDAALEGAGWQVQDRHRDHAITANRKRLAKTHAANRKALGIVPAFLKKKGA
jgi:hypothetical protein